MNSAPYKDFGFRGHSESHMHRHFMARVLALAGNIGPATRVLDVGCGNGATLGVFADLGCQVTGIDLSETGIAIARERLPDGRFEILPADEHLLTNLGVAPFDLLVSTEVIEHVYAPRLMVQGCLKALKPGGRLILTTPYHGWLKNLAISIAGKWDAHADPLWDGGHIKLWSRRTLTRLLEEAGFENIQFRGAGRLPFLWMTMAVSGDKPEEPGA